MINGQKLIKLIAFSLVMFTFLLNIVYVGYVEYREIYFSENNIQIDKNYHDADKNNTLTENYLRSLCLSFTPANFFSTYYSLADNASLMILVSIMALFIIYLYRKIFKIKIFSRKEIYILMIAVTISIMLSISGSLIEPDYDYFGMGCTEFL
jgi:hypothetical protein